MEEHVTGIARAAPGRRLPPSSWQFHPVEIVLPIDVVRKMFRRARQWSVEEGGRFDSRTSAVLLWSHRGRPPAGGLLGSFSVRWRQPGAGLATIHEVAWNPAHGGSLEETCRALEVLAGRM
jgi:hypothetical protein